MSVSRACKLYVPSASETVALEPVLPVSVIETPGSAAPCSSVTLPVTEPTSVWAEAGTARRTRRRRPTALVEAFIHVLLLSDRRLERLAVVVGGPDCRASPRNPRHD